MQIRSIKACQKKKKKQKANMEEIDIETWEKIHKVGCVG